MAYIDPEGIFYGDRMAMLSDEARLYWPYFWCASNSVGRIELNYWKVIGIAFNRFKIPPTEEHFWRLAREYRDAYLLFIYKHKGQIWGQWDVSERYLPDYKTVADKRTPAPDQEKFLEWKQQYIDTKSSEIDNPIDGNISQKFQRQIQQVPMERKGNGSGKEVEEPPAKPGGEKNPIPFRDNAEALAAEYAPRIYERHPRPRRDIGLNAVRKSLKKILFNHQADARAEVMRQIDENHAGWCASDTWTKDEGEYAKALGNWLAPTMGRFDAEPPSRAGPKGKTATIYRTGPALDPATPVDWKADVDEMELAGAQFLLSRDDIPREQREAILTRWPEFREAHDVRH